MDSEEKMQGDTSSFGFNVASALEHTVQESFAVCEGVVTGIKDLSETNDEPQIQADPDTEMPQSDHEKGIKEAGPKNEKAGLDQENKGGVGTEEIESDTEKAKLDTEKAEVDTEEAEVDTEEAEVDTEKAELDTEEAEVDTEKAELDTEEAEVDTGKAEVDTGKAEVDTGKAEESGASVEYSDGRGTSLNLSSQPTLCEVSGTYEGIGRSSLASENEGFPETGQSFSLASYLSDFKSSSSSDLDLLDMSESCLQEFFGKLDSPLTETSTPQHKQEEDAVEDNRCPSTFIVSDREDSLMMQHIALGADAAGAMRRMGHIEPEQMQPNQQREENQDRKDCLRQEHVCEEIKENILSPQERSIDAGEQVEVFGALFDSVREGESVFSKSPSGDEMQKERGDSFVGKLDSALIDSHTAVHKEEEDDAEDDRCPSTFFVSCLQEPWPMQPQKETPCSMKPATMSNQAPATQIISEEHRQALQLLGLSNCPSDSNNETGSLSLNMLSLSDESSSLSQTFRNMTEVSPLCHRDRQETDLVSFVSDGLDENVLLSTDMGSRPPVRDPDYVNEGYILRIEQNHPIVHSDCESDMSVESPQHTPPPISHCLISSRDEQMKRKESMSHENLPAEPSVTSFPEESSSQTDLHLANHEFSENLAENSLSLDSSFLGLPPRNTAGEIKTTEENPPLSKLMPERCETPKGNSYRPIPAPRKKKVSKAELSMSWEDAKKVESQYKIPSEKERGDSSIPFKDSCPPPQGQKTGISPGHLSSLQNSDLDLFTIKPTLEPSPYPCKKSKQSDDDIELLIQSSQSPANPDTTLDMPANMLAWQARSPQHEVSRFSEADHMESTIQPWNQNLDSQKAKYRTGCELAEPYQGSQLPPTSHRIHSTSQNHCVSPDIQRPESHAPLSSVQTASQQSSGPCVNNPPPWNLCGQGPRMEAYADAATVMVSGQNLGENQQELCSLYFESPKHSGGGENNTVWDQQQKCFLVTFMDAETAKRVAARDHKLQNSPIEVQLWSPERLTSGQSMAKMHNDRVLVSGFRPETSVDCIQNYLECSLEVDVSSVEINSGDRSALIVFETPVEKIDVAEMEQACQASPLEKGVCLSFRGVPVSIAKAPVISTVLVEGLAPRTLPDAILFFFRNKKRNGGGPVKKVDRELGSTTALVHFENAEDAESVVKKGGHKLDGQELSVSLHQASNSVDKTEQRTPPQPSAMAESSSSRFGTTPDKTRPQNQYNQHPPMPQMTRGFQELPSPSDGRGFTGGRTGSQFSSSASAQMKQGGPDYSPASQSRPPRSTHSNPTDLFSPPGPQGNRKPLPQTSTTSGEGAYRKPPSAQHHANAVNSMLIDSGHNQPADKFEKIEDCFSGSQSNPWTSRPPQSTEHDGFRPPSPGFKPEIVQPNPPVKKIHIPLGSDVIDKIKCNKDLLTQMIQDLRSLNSKFHWEPPNHIIIKCWNNGTENWEKKVSEVMQCLVQKITQQMPRDRQFPQKPTQERDGSEMNRLRSVNKAGMLDTSSSAPHAPTASAVSIQKPIEIGIMKDTIPSLKPGQVKILKMPKALETLRRDYPGLEISVNETEKIASVTAPEGIMKKAFSDVLAFSSQIGEKKVALSRALAQMYIKKDTVEWIQKTLIEKCGLPCDWEVCDDHIILYGQQKDLLLFEQRFKEVFQEYPMPLGKKEACLLKSPAWTSLKEKMQETKNGECPAPILLSEGDKIIIVDTPSNMSRIRAALRKFFDENQLKKEVVQVSPNKVKFLQQHRKEEVKAILQKARDAGVSAQFTNNGMEAEGPKDSLDETVEKVRNLVGMIKEDKMTFKKPGMATYLTGPKGQEFLSQTGRATECYITTKGGGGTTTSSDGDHSVESEGQILAEISLDANHQVSIVQGDITQCQVDAIVNAANTRLSHGAGVAYAIVKAGGQRIQDESYEIADKEELSEGEVVVTGAGSLSCSHVLHAVGPIWKGGYQGEDKILTDTVKTALKKAEDMELTSVAMPAISCGIFLYPVDQATSTIMEAIHQHFKEVGSSSCLKKLIVIDVKPEPLQGLLKAAKKWFGQLVKVKGALASSSHSGRQGGSSEHRSDRDSNSDHGYGGKSRSPIKVIPGEIAKSKADVIVCATHPSLDLRKGILSKSILEKGGEVIQQDLKKYLDQRGPAQLGQVIWTSGGNLDCKAVYHLSLPGWRDDRGQTLRSALKSCLDAASKKNARSIAFPTLGTGRLGYPGEQVASIMFSAIGEWFQKNRHSSIKEVQIIVFNRDSDTLEAFKAVEKHGGASHRSENHSGDRYSGDRHSGSGGGRGGRHHGGDRNSRHSGGGHRGDRQRDSRHGGGESRTLKTKVGRVTVMVKEGSILEEPCDAIVNTSNDNLDLSFGVLSKEISKACGPDLAAECRAQRDKMAETGVAVTEVDSSKLACGTVIHISADRFKRDWQEGILAVLREADKERIRSISLPALGTGGRGADPEALAEAMQRAVSEFSDRARNVQEVRVVVFQKQLLDLYVSAFDPGAATGGYDHSDTSEEREGGGHSSRKDTGREIDVFIYAALKSAIAEARDKIYKHMKYMCTSHTESNSLIANFSRKQTDELFKLQKKHDVEISLDQKKSSITIKGVEINVHKAVSSLKDIMLSATTERHLAAGMPPVRWQYESGKGKFSDFDPEQVLDIEAAFKKKKEDVHFSDKRGRKYKIVFKDYKEYPLDPKGHPVTVRRRDILGEKRQEIPLPAHWEPMKGTTVKRVDLKPDSNEYKRVAAHFGGQAQIKKIERIQNPSLFQQYKVKKRELEQNNPKGIENEKRLFHGTPSDSVDGIITNGFNRSYCGRHGTALGCGVYFAANSTTSMGYAQGGHMFQARVLVGEYTQGNSSMRMAPNKPNSNRPYDSVGNAPQSANVFVIFHDSQAYPEYLISF